MKRLNNTIKMLGVGLVVATVAAGCAAKKGPSAGPAAAAAATSYTVVRGDSLWRIAAASAIYGNPYMWPLIYKANPHIKDADLIYPGDKEAIPRGESDAEIKRAVKHAKTRGEWALGPVEPSDTRYREGG